LNVPATKTSFASGEEKENVTRLLA